MNHNNQPKPTMKIQFRLSESKLHDKLTSFEKTSNVAKKYVCDLCDYSAITKRCVNEHTQFNHEGKTLECTQCYYVG